MKNRSLLMFAALTAIFFLFGTVMGQIPLPEIPENNTTENLPNMPTGTPGPEWIQTRDAIQMMQTKIAQTQAAFAATQTQAAAPTQRPTATPGPTNTPKPTAVSVKAGDIITFGHYEQDNNLYNGSEPIEWRVLAVENGRALLISKYALDAKPYHDEIDKNITWEKCLLRGWLNEDFYNKAFDRSEKSRILQVKIKNPDNPKYGTQGGNDTRDNIFLLSIDEANRYFASDDDRKCLASDYAKENGAYNVYINNERSWWWLRSPGYESFYAALVSPDGGVGISGDIIYSDLDAVRPAFWLDLYGIIL